VPVCAGLPPGSRSHGSSASIRLRGGAYRVCRSRAPATVRLGPLIAEHAIRLKAKNNKNCLFYKNEL
jgi:hypothetical protein